MTQQDELLIWMNREKQKQLLGFEPIVVFHDLPPELRTATAASMLASPHLHQHPLRRTKIEFPD
jgi:hypothetical protein